MLFNILRIGKHFGKQLEATLNCRGHVTIHIIYFHKLINEYINGVIYLYTSCSFTVCRVFISQLYLWHFWSDNCGPHVILYYCVWLCKLLALNIGNKSAWCVTVMAHLWPSEPWSPTGNCPDHIPPQSVGRGTGSSRYQSGQNHLHRTPV